MHLATHGTLGFVVVNCDITSDDTEFKASDIFALQKRIGFLSPGA